jgi:hypothetical protein
MRRLGSERAEGTQTEAPKHHNGRATFADQALTCLLVWRAGDRSRLLMGATLPPRRHAEEAPGAGGTGTA